MKKQFATALCTMLLLTSCTASSDSKKESSKDSLISVTQADKAAYKEQIKSSEYDNISVSKDFELCFPKQKDASNAERLSLFRENFKFYKKAE